MAPLALATILRAASSSQGLVGGPHGNANAITVLDILAIGACFIGTLNAVREIVKEKSIYTRERAAGLSAGAYLWSKLVWTHDASTWLTDMGLPILLAVVFAFITYWLLERAKPGRR
jgi:hypothetical protein